VEGDGMHPIVVFLCDNHTQCVARGIGMHDEGLRPVRGFEHWFARADVLQATEGCLAGFRPVPLAVLACEVVERSRDVGKVRDEGPVKVTEPKEAPDILDARRGRPSRDPLDFYRIHTDGTVADDHTKIFDLLFVELALRGFEEETQCL